MSTAPPTLDLVQICRDQAHAVGPALGRAWNRSVRCVCAEGPATSVAETILELSRPGLVTAWVHDGQAGVLLVPQGAVLPAAYGTPPADQLARSHAAAATIGKLLLPGGGAPDATRLAAVEDLSQLAGQFGEAVQLVRLTLTSGDQSSPAWIAWPLPEDVLPENELTAAGDGSTASGPASGSDAARHHAGDFDEGIRHLPAYMRSLLKIKVPIVVTLASKRDALSSILQLGLGTILQFEKGCDETLDVEVAGRRIAEGEPVKVGDKFGLRITAIALPEERFEPIGK
jgi:flagellar motor switch/type III secretory pathway protein FliN